MLPISLSGLLRHAEETFRTRGADFTQPYKTKGKQIADALKSLEQGQAAAIFQLRCGHCPLKKFLHRLGTEEDDKCETCQAVESPAHFLVYCKKYNRKRRAFRNQLKEEGTKVNKNLVWKLLDSPKVFPCLAQYINATGRFHYLSTYLEN